ncbi:MAG: hypothetical protein EON93_18200, partial [Burkholderiales bacterium]
HNRIHAWSYVSVVDQSRSRLPVARARLPDRQHQTLARPLTEPVARSLEYWAATRGGWPALFEDKAMLTYREWNEYADMLADAFVGRGIGANDVVAVRCRNRLEWAVIALACSKIDARLLTLDPNLPPRVLRERLILSGAVAIIVGDIAPSRLSPALEGLPFLLRATMNTVSLGFYNFWDLFPAVAQPRFGHATPALLAWTSGAASRALHIGFPCRRSTPASKSRPPMAEYGNTLITVPMHRIWGPVQFWSALAAGRTISLLSDDDAATTLAFIRKRRITHWSALPESFRRMRELGTEAVRKADTSSLRELEIGGAPATQDLKAWVADLFAPILSEAFGSTETGRISTISFTRKIEKPGSCGRPMQDVTVEVRDSSGQRLPPGAVGTIWARTPRTLENDAFTPAAQRVLRDANGFVATGNTGRLDEDGYIYLADRTEAQPADYILRAG